MFARNREILSSSLNAGAIILRLGYVTMMLFSLARIVYRKNLLHGKGISRVARFLPMAVFIGIWCIGVSLNGSLPVLWDAGDYLNGAYKILDGDLQSLSAGTWGTLVRPYLYPLFLALGLNVRHIVIDVFWGTDVISDRVWLGVFQGLVYIVAVNFFARSLERRNASLGVGVKIGLFCQPFIPFLMTEMLSEALLVSSCLVCAALLISADNYHGLKQKTRFITAVGVLPMLVVIRSAMSVSVLIAIVCGIVCFCVFTLKMNKKDVTWMLSSVVVSGIAAAGILSPQATMMVVHNSINPSDDSLWGSGSAAFLFGITMLKFGAIVVDCGEVKAGGIVYLNPFVDSRWLALLGADRLRDVVVTYVETPFYAIAHVLNGLSWDFMFTYNMVTNMYANVAGNIYSNMMVGLALAGLFIFRGTAISSPASWRFLIGPGTLTVSLVTCVNLAQLAVISTETRYGIVPWIFVSCMAGVVAVVLRVAPRVVVVRVLVLVVFVVIIGVAFTYWAWQQSPKIVLMLNGGC